MVLYSVEGYQPTQSFPCAEWYGESIKQTKIWNIILDILVMDPSCKPPCLGLSLIIQISDLRKAEFGLTRLGFFSKVSSQFFLIIDFKFPNLSLDMKSF